jgi:hypothetical protein
MSFGGSVGRKFSIPDRVEVDFAVSALACSDDMEKITAISRPTSILALRCRLTLTISILLPPLGTWS